jgi:glycosyltransferase involved in cell wall biosynthesis
VYNEAEYLASLITRLLAVPLWEQVPIEIVAIDDGSTDGSGEALEEMAGLHPGAIQVVRHERNRGKGAAIRSAIERATGEFAVIQDSDLEYNPQDLPHLLRPLLEGRADAVYGSRFLISGERRVMYFWHSLANHLLTTVCNMVADLNLTDVETGYKAFRLSLVRSIPLRCNGFGMEPELTVKLAQRRIALYEVPISYYGRTYAEGKKIGFTDAIEALVVILYFGLRRDIYLDHGARILDSLAQTPRFNRWLADTIQPVCGNSRSGNRRGHRQPLAVPGCPAQILHGQRHRRRAHGPAAGKVCATAQSEAYSLRSLIAGRLRAHRGLRRHGHLPERARAYPRRRGGSAQYPPRPAPWWNGNRAGTAGSIGLRHAGRGAGPLSALFRSRVTEEDGSGWIPGGSRAVLQPCDAARVVAERPPAEAQPFQPLSALVVRPLGLALASNGPPFSMALRLRHRHRPQARQRELSTARAIERKQFPS